MSLVLIVPNTVVYLACFGLAALINKLRGKQVLTKQSAGNMGVALLFVILFLVGSVHIAPMLSPGESSPEAAFSQGESVGRLAGTLALPALLMAFLLGRLGRKSKSK